MQSSERGDIDACTVCILYENNKWSCFVLVDLYWKFGYVIVIGAYLKGLGEIKHLKATLLFWFLEVMM